MVDSAARKLDFSSGDNNKKLITLFESEAAQSEQAMFRLLSKAKRGKLAALSSRHLLSNDERRCLNLLEAAFFLSKLGTLDRRIKSLRNQVDCPARVLNAFKKDLQLLGFLFWFPSDPGFCTPGQGPVLVIELPDTDISRAQYLTTKLIFEIKPTSTGPIARKECYVNERDMLWSSVLEDYCAWHKTESNIQDPRAVLKHFSKYANRALHKPNLLTKPIL